MRSKKIKLILLVIVIIGIAAILTVIVHGNNKYQTDVSRIIQKMDIVENLEDEEWKNLNVEIARDIVKEKTGSSYIEGISDNGRYVVYIDKNVDSFIDRDEFIVFDLENNAKVQSYNFRKRREYIDMVYLDNEGKYFYVKTSSKKNYEAPNKFYYVDLKDENKNMEVILEDTMSSCKVINNGENVIYNGNKNDKDGIYNFNIKTKEINLIKEDAYMWAISHNNKRILIAKWDKNEKEGPFAAVAADWRFYVGNFEDDNIDDINFLYKIKSYEEVNFPNIYQVWSNDNTKVRIIIYDNRSEEGYDYIFTLKEF